MSRQSPCSSCPFRIDIDFSLSELKVQSILEALQSDEHFACHNTTMTTGHRSGAGTACIGAAIFLEHVRPGGVRANLSFRLKEAYFHEFHRDALRMDVSVFSDVESFVTARTKLMRFEVAQPSL